MRRASKVPVPGGKVPVPGGKVPVPGGKVPVPGGKVPVPGGKVPVPGDKGQALVETALTLPLLVLLLLVCVEGGRLILAKMAAERLARETAEAAGAVGAPTSEVWDYMAGQIGVVGNVLGEVQSARLVVYDRAGGERCRSNYPAASGSCWANYGDWIEVELRVQVHTWFGDVDLAAWHRAAAWRAFVP